MESRILELEKQVADLTRSVRALEARLQATPAPPTLRAEGVPAATAEPMAPLPPVLPQGADMVSLVPLMGRTLLAVGGAFLIRALSERGSLPGSTGPALGLLFALFWAVMAVRTSPTRQSTTFHGFSAALIGFPLIVETSTRLGVWDVHVGGLLLLLLTFVLVTAAVRNWLRLVAWGTVLGSLGVAALLMRSLGPSWTQWALLFFLAISTAVLSEVRGWTGLRWPVLLVATLMATRGVFSAAARPEEHLDVGAALAVLQALAVVFAVALVVRTLALRRGVSAFEVVEAALVLSMVFSATSRVREDSPWWSALTGAALVLVAVGAMLASLRASDSERSIDVWFFGSVGLAALLTGGALLVRGPTLALLWAVAAVVTALAGRRSERATMYWVFTLVLSWAAGLAAGLPTLLRNGLAGLPQDEWEALTWDAALVFALLFGAYVLVSVRVPSRSPVAHLPRAGLLVLLLAGALSFAIAAAREALGGHHADVAALVLARTLLLAVGALALALARRRGGPVEFAWVAWLVLALAGLKLLAQDLPQGHATTLFVAFLSVGVCLILLPRLMRQTYPNQGPSDPDQVRP